MDYFLQEVINFIFRADFAFAQVIGERTPSFEIINPAIFGSIEEVLTAIIGFVLNIAFFIIAPAMYLWAGYQYLTSIGNPGKIASANKTLIWTTIGIVVVLTAQGMAFVIRDILAPQEDPVVPQETPVIPRQTPIIPNEEWEAV